MKSLMISLFFALFAAAALPFGQNDVPFQVVARGQNGGELQGGLKVFRTARAFEEFAKEVGQDIPKRLVKEVDWDKDQIVVVSAGQQPSGGYSVDVKRIQTIDIQRLVLEAVVNKPAPGSINTQALTTPFIVLRMPRQVCTIKIKFVDSGS